MSREYTAVPHEYLEEMDCLSDAEFGRLIRALLAYSMTGEEQTLSGGEKAHWKRVRNRENRYQESFDNQDKVKTDRAKTAANARWSNAKNAYACVSIPSNAKNAKTKTKTKTDTEYTSPDGDVCAEQNLPSAPPAITLPLNDGKEYAVSAGQIDEWGQLYPAVDVMQQLRNMKGWLDGNPQKRKTGRGILAFINRWLAKEQDRPGKRSDGPRKGSYAGGPRELDDEEVKAIRQMMEESDDVGTP